MLWVADTCSNMIRCSLCMAWYNIECAGEDASYNGVWCYNSCRTLPLPIHDLIEQVKQLASSVESIQSRELALKSEVQQLKAENGKLRSKLTHSVQHANNLAKLIETMSFPSTRPTGVTGSDDCDGPSPPDQSHLPCCVHNASTVPWTSAGQFGRPRGVRGRPWYDLWRLRCVISHPMDARGLPPGRPPSGRPRDTQFGIDWSLLPSGCPQGVRTAEVQPITARTHYGQEVGLPTVRPKPEVDVP